MTEHEQDAHDEDRAVSVDAQSADVPSVDPADSAQPATTEADAAAADEREAAVPAEDRPDQAPVGHGRTPDLGSSPTDHAVGRVAVGSVEAPADSEFVKLYEQHVADGEADASAPAEVKEAVPEAGQPEDDPAAVLEVESDEVAEAAEAAELGIEPPRFERPDVSTRVTFEDPDREVRAREQGLEGTPTLPGQSPKHDAVNQAFVPQPDVGSAPRLNPDGTRAAASPEAVGQPSESYSYLDTWQPGTNPVDVVGALHEAEAAAVAAEQEAEVVPDAEPYGPGEADWPADSDEVDV